MMKSGVRTGLTSRKNPAAKPPARERESITHPRRLARATTAGAKAAGKKKASAVARKKSKALKLWYANIVRHRVDAVAVISFKEDAGQVGVGVEEARGMQAKKCLRIEIARDNSAIRAHGEDNFYEDFTSALKMVEMMGVKTLAFEVASLTDVDGLLEAALVTCARFLNGKTSIERIDFVAGSEETYRTAKVCFDELAKLSRVALPKVKLRQQLSEGALQVYAAMAECSTVGPAAERRRVELMYGVKSYIGDGVVSFEAVERPRKDSFGRTLRYKSGSREIKRVLWEVVSQLAVSETTTQEQRVEELRRCVREVLAYADQTSAYNIAFPVEQYDLGLEMQTIVQTILEEAGKFLKQSHTLRDVNILVGNSAIITGAAAMFRLVQSRQGLEGIEVKGV